MGAVCGRAKLKSDGEPAIVALQEAGKNSRQSGTILENSPKGDSQSNGAAENAVREEEGMKRTGKMSVEEELKAVIDNKHVLLPWLVMHARVLITRYKTVHDGKTAYQRIKNKRPSNKMQPFGEKVVWMMLNDNHRRNKLDSIRHFRKLSSGIVPRTGEFVVLTPEGCSGGAHDPQALRRPIMGHGIHEQGQRCTVGLQGQRRRDDINDCGIPERADARPPDSQIEMPPASM